MDDWAELLGFLRHPNKEVRKMAAQNVVGFTKSEDHVYYLKTRNQDALRWLLNLLGDEESAIVGYAASALINLSEDPYVVALLVNYGVVTRLMATLAKAPPAVEQLKLGLLANVTSLDSDAVTQFLQSTDEDMRGYYLTKLLLTYPIAKVTAAEGGVLGQWVLTVLVNVSRALTGQELLMQHEPLLETFPALLKSPNALIRGSAVMTLKNLAMATVTHAELCSRETPVPLLLRLSEGAEKNTDIRRTAADVLRLLAHSEPGVNFFDSVGGKKLVQAAIAKETVHDIQEILRQTEEKLDDVQDAFVVQDAAPAAPSAAAAPAAPTPTPEAAPAAPTVPVPVPAVPAGEFDPNAVD